MKWPLARSPLTTIDRFSTWEGDRWSHSPLSNGFIEPDGTHVEGEYQAYSKTTDENERKAILFTPEGMRRSPFGLYGAKYAGRNVALRPDFAEVKVPVMAFFVQRKFTEHTVCRDYLLATGSARLVEGNTWHDNFWGDCHCLKSSCYAPGVNALGIILMTIRTTLTPDNRETE